MIRVGLTGGIGAGKSTVANMLEEHGAVIIDADEISRELVEPGEPALHLLVEEFGPEIIRPDGSLNRGALAAAAFSDEEGTAKLNAIMHPLIRAESTRRLQAAAEEGADIVVYDMPLLVETDQADLVDLVVVVDVPVEMQIERATSMRGLEEFDVKRRIAVQATREDRRAVADVVIDNSGDRWQTQRQVDELWEKLRAVES